VVLKTRDLFRYAKDGIFSLWQVGALDCWLRHSRFFLAAYCCLHFFGVSCVSLHFVNVHVSTDFERDTIVFILCRRVWVSGEKTRKMSTLPRAFSHRDCGQGNSFLPRTFSFWICMWIQIVYGILLRTILSSELYNYQDDCQASAVLFSGLSAPVKVESCWSVILCTTALWCVIIENLEPAVFICHAFTIRHKRLGLQSILFLSSFHAFNLESQWLRVRVSNSCLNMFERHLLTVFALCSGVLGAASVPVILVLFKLESRRGGDKSLNSSSNFTFHFWYLLSDRKESPSYCLGRSCFSLVQAITCLPLIVLKLAALFCTAKPIAQRTSMFVSRTRLLLRKDGHIGLLEGQYFCRVDGGT